MADAVGASSASRSPSLCPNAPCHWARPTGVGARTPSSLVPPWDPSEVRFAGSEQSASRCRQGGRQPGDTPLAGRRPLSASVRPAGGDRPLPEGSCGSPGVAFAVLPRAVPCRTVAGRRGAPIGWAGATSLSLDLRSEGRRGGTLRDNAQVLTPAMTTYAVTPCPGTSRCAPGLCFRLRGRDHACAVPGPRTSWPGPPAPSCSHPPQICTHGEHGDSLGHSRGHREARIGAGSHLHGPVS